jgi:hypothetical protein
MALVFTAESTFQGQALLSVGARECDHRDAARIGNPGGRW